MKTILIAITLMLGLGMVSCEKACTTSNCGIITNDEIEYDGAGNTYYSLTVQSDCSGVNKKVYVDYASWLNGHVGSSTCISWVAAWSPTAPIVSTKKVQNKSL
jgi:hypothetical protein